MISASENAENFIDLNKFGRSRIGMDVPFILHSTNNTGKTLLDLGCGNGFYHQQILSNKPLITSLTGVELNPLMINQAKSTEKVKYVCCDAIQYLKTTSQKFDIIMAAYLTCHLNKLQLQELFQAMGKNLTEGSQFLLYSMDLNAFLNSKVKSGALKQLTVLSEKHIEDGMIIKLKIHKLQIPNHYWSPQCYLALAEKNNLKAKCQFVTADVICSKVYTEEERKEIDQSTCIYVIKITK